MGGRIAIAGGGIAGLTTALALAGRGIRSVVYERAEELAEVGAGIQLSPNASRVLVGLGLAESIEKTAVRPEGLTVRSGRSGAILASMTYGKAFEERYGAPYWVIHRGELQTALLDKVAATPEIELLTDHAVIGCTETAGGVEIAVDCEGQPAARKAAALIGADGVWSTIRAKVVGLRPAAFSGRTAWRATVEAERFPADLASTTGLWLGSGAHLVHYPVSGGRKVNLVAIVEDREPRTGWSRSGEAEDLLARFGHWHDRARAILRLPENWLTWSLYRAPWSPAWSKGRTVLIGDAAHAMAPFLAQGGAMAIEDAAVLAACVAGDEAGPARAFERYARLRGGRVRRVMNDAWLNGWIYHLPQPMALARNIGMRLIGPRGLAFRFDWIYRWRPEESILEQSPDLG